MELVWEGKIGTGEDAAGIVEGSLEWLEALEVYSDSLQALEDAPLGNSLLFGDNKLVLQALLERYRSKVDLIYIDPPFDIGGELKQEIKLGTTEEGAAAVRLPAYRDSWGKGRYSFAQTMYERLLLCRELLRTGGALFVHCDYRTTALFRLMLDELFGADNHVNEIIWFYKTGGVPEKLGFGKKHDTIHYYVKTRQGVTWNPQKEKSYLQHRYGFSNIEILEDERGNYCVVNCRDVFDIPALRGNQPEREDYPTQKPEQLLERLIEAASSEGDLVLDCFCGSGTTAAVAERLGRRWIAVDSGSIAVDCTKRRLLNGTAPGEDAAVNPAAFSVYSIESEERRRVLEELCADGNPKEFFRRSAGFYGLDSTVMSEDGSALWGRKNEYQVCICSPYVRYDAERCFQHVDSEGVKPRAPLLFLAWDAEEDLGSALFRLGEERGHAAYAVRVSPLLLNPSASPGSVITSLPVVAANLVETETGKSSAMLVDYRVQIIAGPKSLRDRPESASGLSLVTFWGLECGFEEESPFRPQWYCSRSRSGPVVDAQSEAVEVSGASAAQARIVVNDVFGNRTVAELSAY